MSEEKRTVSFTIVAFRYDRQNSILYKNTINEELVGYMVDTALKKLKADVISIRRVYEKRPIP